MLKLLNTIVVGLVGAGIVHIVILFLLPRFVEHDAWTRMEALAPAYRTVHLAPGDRDDSLLRSMDPLFEADLCRFDLSDGTVRIHSDGQAPYWSLSVYDRKGRNLYSVNDRVSTDGKLDVVVATPAQMIELRKGLPEAFKNSVFIEADATQGMALVRSFVPDATWKVVIGGFLDSVTCALN